MKQVLLSSIFNIVFNSTMLNKSIFEKRWLVTTFLIILIMLSLSHSVTAQFTEVWRKSLTNDRIIQIQVENTRQNLLLIGSDTDASSRKRIMLQKADENGSMLWSKINPGESNSIADSYKSSWLDSKGNIYIQGSSDMAGEYIDFIQKLTSEGTPIWKKVYNNSKEGGITIKKVVKGSDDAIYFVGTVSESGKGYLVIQKLTPEGNVAWDKRYTPTTDDGWDHAFIGADNNGNIYVATTAKASDGAYKSDVALLKFSASNGNLIYSKSYVTQWGGMQNEIVDKLMISPSGNVYILTSVEEAYYYDLQLYTISPAGDLIQLTSIGKTPETELLQAEFTADESLLFLCWDVKYRTTWDFYLTKFSSTGNRIWFKSFNVYEENKKIRQFVTTSFTQKDNGHIVIAGSYSYFTEHPSWWEEPYYIEQPKMALALIDKDGKELLREINQKDNSKWNGLKGITSSKGVSNLYGVGLLGDNSRDVNSKDYVLMKFADCSSLKASAGPDKTSCIGEQVQLEASGGKTYSWSPSTGLSASNIANPKASPEKTTTYTVTVTNENGCKATDEVTITINSKPTASITAEGETSFCKGGSVVLKANTGSGLTYQWIRNEVAISGATESTFTANSSGNYTVSVKNNTCAASSAAVEVKVFEPFSVEAGAEQTTCLNTAAFNLSGFSPAGGIWSGKGITSDGKFDPAKAGTGKHTLTYTVTKDKCTVTATKNIIVNATISEPGAISGNSSICAGANNLTYSVEAVVGAVEYVWSAPGFDITAGQGTRTITLKAGNTGGKISVVARGSCGSSAASEKEINVGQMPDLSIAADGSTSFCGSGSVKLSVENSGSYTYQWAKDGTSITGATSASYTANSSGKYTVIVSNGSCSRTTAAITIEVGTAISNNTINGDQTICSGVVAEPIKGSIPGGGSGSFNYQWESSTNDTDYTAIQGAATKDYTPVNLTKTTWFRRKTTSGSCSNTSPAVKITVNTAPYVSLQVFEPTCINSEPFTLAGGSPAGGIYTGPGVNNGLFNPAAAGPGNHTITYTYAENGKCEAKATQTIQVKSDCSVTGVEDEEPQYLLSVYPNPSSAIINIKLELEKRSDLTVRIVDAHGSVIKERTYKKVYGEFIEKLDLKGKASGIYLIQFITEEGVKTRRVVKQ